MKQLEMGSNNWSVNQVARDSHPYPQVGIHSQLILSTMYHRIYDQYTWQVNLGSLSPSIARRVPDRNTRSFITTGVDAEGPSNS